MGLRVVSIRLGHREISMLRELENILGKSRSEIVRIAVAYLYNFYIAVGGVAGKSSSENPPQISLVSVEESYALGPVRKNYVSIVLD
ncbi:MAG: hypothetical protein C0179_05855 [Fervidicoccus sp.]|nr:MAG: hypothetical protein C0179_05855 [Fervidicoccus sp.]